MHSNPPRFFLPRLVGRVSMVLLIACLSLSTLGQPQKRKAQQSQTASAADLQRQRDLVSLLESGKLDQADDLTRKAVAAEPKNPNARVLRGIVLDHLGRLEEAEREYRFALRLDPVGPMALTNLGVLLARTNRSDEAIVTLEKALAAAPDHKQAAFNLSVLYFDRKDYQRATPMLERVAGVTPSGEVTTTDIG